MAGAERCIGPQNIVSWKSPMFLGRNLSTWPATLSTFCFRSFGLPGRLHEDSVGQHRCQGSSQREARLYAGTGRATGAGRVVRSQAQYFTALSVTREGARTLCPTC